MGEADVSSLSGGLPSTTETPARHQCHCGKAFPTAFKLQRHSLVHSGMKPFSCSECGQCFAQEASLKLHVQHKHLGWRPHSCEECGKSFGRAEHLRAHYKTHGRETKPPIERKKVSVEGYSAKAEVLSCTFCEGGKVFAHAWKLERHLLIHTGERPFPCPLCGAAFNQNSSLKSHMRTHTGEKPFACQECGRAFTRADHLRYHLRTHNNERPFECEQCGKRFASSSGIARHRSEHKKRMRRLECTVCRAGFSRIENLRCHLNRVHVGRSQDIEVDTDTQSTFCSKDAVFGTVADGVSAEASSGLVEAEAKTQLTQHAWAPTEAAAGAAEGRLQEATRGDKPDVETEDGQVFHHDGAQPAPAPPPSQPASESRGCEGGERCQGSVENAGAFRNSNGIDANTIANTGELAGHSKDAGDCETWSWQVHPSSGGEMCQSRVQEEIKETKPLVKEVGAFPILLIKNEVEDMISAEQSGMNSGANHNAPWNKPDFYSTVSQEPASQNQRSYVKGEFVNLNYSS